LREKNADTIVGALSHDEIANEGPIHNGKLLATVPTRFNGDLAVVDCGVSRDGVTERGNDGATHDIVIERVDGDSHERSRFLDDMTLYSDGTSVLAYDRNLVPTPIQREQTAGMSR
jgi:hypothetical protein